MHQTRSAVDSREAYSDITGVRSKAGSTTYIQHRRFLVYLLTAEPARTRQRLQQIRKRSQEAEESIGMGREWHTILWS